MDIKASIVLTNADREIEKGVEKEIQRIISARMITIVESIERDLEEKVGQVLRESPVYSEIKSGGRLLGELGLPNPSDIDDIIDVWARNVEVDYRRSGGRFGSLQIGMIESDYSDVLSQPQASFIYASNRGPIVIEWLRWLLLEGRSVIVSGYRFESAGNGRTGLGTMKESRGGGWRVPARFAGDGGDNFATRALLKIESVIDDSVRQQITKGLK